MSGVSVVVSHPSSSLTIWPLTKQLPWRLFKPTKGHHLATIWAEVGAGVKTSLVPKQQHIEAVLKHKKNSRKSIPLMLPITWSMILQELTWRKYKKLRWNFQEIVWNWHRTSSTYTSTWTEYQLSSRSYMNTILQILSPFRISGFAEVTQVDTKLPFWPWSDCLESISAYWFLLPTVYLNTIKERQGHHERGWNEEHLVQDEDADRLFWMEPWRRLVSCPSSSLPHLKLLLATEPQATAKKQYHQQYIFRRDLHSI